MLEFVGENGTELLEFVASLIGAFAVLATMTKNESDNAIMAWLLKAVNFLGANLGRAKNG
jgi:hypothetical protein